MKRKKKSRSLRTTLTMQLTILLLVILIFYQALTNVLKIIPTINEYNYNILHSQLMNRQEQLISNLKTATTHIVEQVHYFTGLIEQYQTTNTLTWSDIDGNDEALENLYILLIKNLIDIMKKESIYTGIFIYLDAVYSEMSRENSMTALYIKDNAPRDFKQDYSDLMLYRGSARLTRELDYPIALSQNWKFSHSKGVDPNSPEQLFITKPMEVANSALGNQEIIEMGYWSEPFKHSPTDPEIITYTLPVYNNENNVVGVIGIEISTDYFQTLISASSIPFETGIFMLSIITNGEKEDEFLIKRDSSVMDGLQRTLFQEGQGEYYKANRVLHLGENKDIFEIYSPGLDSKYIAVKSDLNLYGKLSAFYGEDRVLFCVARKSELLYVGEEVNKQLIITIAVTFLLLAAGLFMLISTISKNIHRLTRQVQSYDVTKKIFFTPTNIKELDYLSEAFMEMSDSVFTNAARMSNIITLVGMPIGAFEENKKRNIVFLTSSIYKLLDIEGGESQMIWISSEKWHQIFPALTNHKKSVLDFEDDNLMALKKNEYELDLKWKSKWLRVRYVDDKEITYGTVVDITEEINEKLKLEYEHNYDSLTSLLNRNSYKKKIIDIIEENPEATGGLIFGDLDNLKYVNDTYGHNIGDLYIQETAKALKAFLEYGGVVARIAGDEFVVYLHNLGSKEKLLSIVTDVMEKVKMQSVEVAPGTREKVKISIGLAFYPFDSGELDELIRYADFAMYEIKHSSKGGIRIFNKDSYERNSYLLHKQNYLDLFLEEKRLKFAFQPIVDVKTQEIHGYEALLRPQIREIKSPLMVLNLAKAQSKLYQVEHLVLTAAMEWMHKNYEEIGNKKIFINSIANQVISSEDWMEIEQKYGYLMSSIVYEIIESENITEDSVKDKFERFRAGNSMIALDDYGSGYSNEKGLLVVKPEIIKVDMSIIQGISRDLSRQQILENIVSYANYNNMKIIAEGIETADDLDTVIMLGVDYIQGFYIGMPSNPLFELPDNLKKEIYKIWQKYYEYFDYNNL